MKSATKHIVKGNSYSVEYAHFEDEFVRQAYLSVEDQLISYQIEHIEKVNDNLYALTIKMKTTQTVMLRGDVWSEVYNFVARIDGQWKFINGVGNIPDDLQENLEKEKYSYHMRIRFWGVSRRACASICSTSTKPNVGKSRSVIRS